MKVINFLFLLPILLISLCPSAKASTIVEKTFPCLTLVTDVSTIDKSKTYVLVADDGENMYAVVDELDQRERLVSLVLTTNVDIKSQNIFFTIAYNSSQKGYNLKGNTTTNTYCYSKYTTYEKNIVTSKDNYIGYFQIQKASDYYNGALVFYNKKSRYITLSKDYNPPLFGLYSSYNHVTDKYINDYLPVLIYEYDASKAATPIGTISIKTAEGYGTYYLDLDYEMPQGVTGYTVTRAENGKLTLEKVYDSGQTVPANTALVVYGDKGTYSVFAPAESTSASMRTTRADVQTKYLYGTVESKLTPYPDESKSYYFYKLCYLTDTDNNKTLGFYWGGQGGAAFINAANRAYMAVKQASASQSMGFAFPETEPTAIENPTQAVAPQPHGIYTLTGAKLNVSDPGQLPHGVFIVDGRKICK